MSNELKYTRIIEAVMSYPWAILPAKLAIIQDLIAFRAAGGTLTADEIRERVGAYEAANGRSTYNSAGGVAVLPLLGTIMPRASIMSEYSGGTSVQGFTQKFRAALADPDVGSIVIDMDSPGGQVSGVPELASEILAARGQKRVVAVANTLAASAAYWIAASADEIVVSPSAEVGSIGVLAMHEDVSAWLEREGVKVNFIHAGKYKVEGNPYEPLTDEARGAIQARVDDYYGMFVDAVAKGRGVSRSDVRGGFGEGRVVGAKEAVKLGMADRVATLDETIARLQNGRRRGSKTGASLDVRQRRLRLAGMGVSVDTAVSGNE